MSKPNVTFEREKAGRYRVLENGEYAGSIKRYGSAWCWSVLGDYSPYCEGWDLSLREAQKRTAAALQQAQDGEAEATS